MLMQEQVFSVEEAAKHLKLHPKTIWRMIRRGELEAHKVGRQYRIRQSEIERVLSGKPREKED